MRSGWAHGVGYMSEARWKELMDQMVEAGMVDKVAAVKTYYTDDFLPPK